MLFLPRYAYVIIEHIIMSLLNKQVKNLMNTMRTEEENTNNDSLVTTRSFTTDELQILESF